MNKNYKDFIATFEGALPQNDCDLIISRFEEFISFNPSSILDGGKQYPTQDFARKDYILFVHNLIPDVPKIINECLNKCITFYAEEYFSLKLIAARSETIKLQKTPPRGGYHSWHPEVTSRQTMERVLTWMIYLNDIPEGEGETEFLWQGVRVKPKAGTCVIWPAQFTHPHRGNPVYSHDKYIATGWYTYTD